VDEGILPEGGSRTHGQDHLYERAKFMTSRAGGYRCGIAATWVSLGGEPQGREEAVDLIKRAGRVCGRATSALPRKRPSARSFCPDWPVLNVSLW
jgi:hypothetical protein